MGKCGRTRAKVHSLPSGSRSTGRLNIEAVETLDWLALCARGPGHPCPLVRLITPAAAGPAALEFTLCHLLLISEVLCAEFYEHHYGSRTKMLQENKSREV